MTRIPAPQRRRELVEAAMRVVAERGVAATTTRAIVAEAGMSLASFHYAFSTRAELMGELVDFVVGYEERNLQPALSSRAGRATGQAGIRDALRAGLQDYLDGVRDDPLREQAMFELTQFAMRSPGLDGIAARQYQRYYDLAADALRAAAANTGMEWDRPVAEVAALLVALTDGLTLAWLVGRDDSFASSILDFAADSIARLAVPGEASATARRNSAQRTGSS